MKTKNFKLHFLFLFFVFFVGCSSTGLRFKEREVKTSDISYTVVNAARDTRPQWIDSPQADSRNLAAASDRNLYFSFESGPKISKEIACNIVRVYARDDLAKKIVDFYLDDRDVEGEIDLNWRLIMASEGSRVFKKALKSSKILATYWERRLYPPKIGDSEEIEGFSCALWIEVSQELFSKALKELADQGLKRFWQTPGWDKVIDSKEEAYRGFHEEAY